MKRFTAVIALVFLIPLVAFVGGCVTTSPKNAQQAILEVRQEYTIAVEAAAAYGQLPRCLAGSTIKVCSSDAVVKQIKVAKDAAKPVIDGAEATVLDPTFDASKSQAIILSAQNALKALTAITAALNLK
jgi:hypothetical protein